MNQMRMTLAKIYTPKWVARRTDAQVLAIYRRLQSQGAIKI